MSPYSQRIINQLKSQPPDGRRIDDLAKDLAIDKADMDSFRKSVQDLLDEGDIILSRDTAVALPPPGPMLEGVFRLHPRGFGFIIPSTPSPHGDLFVPAGRSAKALTGDLVRARVIQEQRRTPGKSPYVGRIVEILQRAEHTYVGELRLEGKQWRVVVDGKSLHDPVVIRDPHARDAKAGDKVVIQLIRFPNEDDQAGELPEGVIIDVLGKSGEIDVETRAVMRAFGLPETFEQAVTDDAHAAAAAFDGRSIPDDREDLTDQLIMTIDPPDARDYDDAIHIRRLDSAAESDHAVWELGVHIADVAHFIKSDGPLDQEARQRGTSVYLPRHVIPMLPELLSNGVCSLQEGVVRYCKSAIMRFDDKGDVLSARVARTAIKSAKRLTYREAQALIDGDLREARKHTKSESDYSRDMIQALGLMNELARIIRARRLKQGMVTLDLPDVELVFDAEGRVIDAVPEDNAFTHTLIEMFMVEANEAVARLFDSLQVPLLRRIHPDPPNAEMGDLRKFARVAGYNIPLNPTRKELQQLLDAVRGKPAQHAIHLAVLQTLSKAEYSPAIIGHFALASEHYAHFTSPIRRYPDLTVHRALEAYLDAADNGRNAPRGGRQRGKVGQILRDDPRCPDEQALTELGRHCSSRERNAEAAERELRTFLVLDLLSSMQGDDMHGTVTGMTTSGIFVQIDKYLVDGFVRVEDLGIGGGRGDQWRLDQKTGTMVARQSGRTIAIGDRFVVRIAKCVPAARRLDLVLINTLARGQAPKTSKSPAKKSRTQPRGARKAHQQTQHIKKVAKKNPRSRRR
jgi:ribonuclease R